MKKFSAFNTYINENKNYMNSYNTVIVFPIQKIEKDHCYLLGFLCIDSPGEYPDTRKNKEMVDIIKFVSSVIYDRLSISSVKKEILTVKKNDICLKLSNIKTRIEPCIFYSVLRRSTSWELIWRDTII